MKSRKVLAVVFVLIVSFSVLVALTSCDAIKQEVNKNLVSFSDTYSIAMSVDGLEIKMLYDGKDMNAEWTCFNGTITCAAKNSFRYDNVGHHFISTTEQQVKWISDEYDSDEAARCLEDYVSIIIRDGDNIVGFVVLHIFAEDENKVIYSVNLVASYEFPQIGSKYQNVSHEYVQQQTDKYIVIDDEYK